MSASKARDEQLINQRNFRRGEAGAALVSPSKLIEVSEEDEKVRRQVMNQLDCESQYFSTLNTAIGLTVSVSAFAIAEVGKKDVFACHHGEACARKYIEEVVMICGCLAAAVMFAHASFSFLRRLKLLHVHVRATSTVIIGCYGYGGAGLVILLLVAFLQQNEQHDL